MLTALELAGFKSFAEKARLEFPAGVTCVVGPNGSGKSNVVDAIKWVMGSQSPKSLRGSEMTDVIFNGSAGRRPLNSAEVTLEFDNRERLFDFGSDTLRITRRVYRSGEGEYLINGSACRLKDIRELLAGTGAGTESYSIIEQGRVDAVLQSSPRDRRALFEEAAGISRFRIKKQEAARRLERVDQNLLRLSDIVDEVEGRLKRVRLQAGKAARYREQSQRLEELRTTLALADWQLIVSRLDELQRQTQAIENRQQAGSEQLEAGEEALAEYATREEAEASKRAELDRQMAQTREQMASVRAAAEAERRRLAELEEALVHERRKLVAARIDANSESAAESLQELQARTDEAATELAAAQQVALRRTAQYEALKSQLAEVRQQRTALKTATRPMQQQIADLDRRVELLGLQSQQSRQRQSQHQSEVDSIAEDVADVQQQLQEAQTGTAALEQQAQKIANALASAQSAVDEASSQIVPLQNELLRLESDLASRRQRLAQYEETEDRLERLRADMTRLLQTDTEASPVAIYGMVADVLHVDFDSALMIEAALGERAQDLVVDDGNELVQVAIGQTEKLTTRARFQRLDAQPVALAIDQIDLSHEPGVMGRADQFVEAAAEFALLVRRLLGRTWIVDRLETAHRLANSIGRGLSFVTFDGEKLAADGTIALGPQSESTGLLLRRREIEQIRPDISRDQVRLEELRDEVERLQLLHRSGSEAVKKHFAENAELANMLAEARRRSATLEERLRQQQQRRSQLEHQWQQAREAAKVQQAELAACQRKRDEMAQELSRAAEHLQVLEGRLDPAESELAQLQSALTEARVTLAKHEQHSEILSAQLSQAKSVRSPRGAEDAELQKAVSELEARLVKCRGLLLGATSRLALLAIDAQQLAGERLLGDRKQRDQRATEREIAGAVRKLRRRLDAEQAELQRARLEEERLKLQQQTLLERMNEEYGIDLAAAAGNATEIAAVAEDERVRMEQELAQLRGDVGKVDAVNLDSLEELDELETRFDELSSQYQDLAGAKASLEKLTSRINADSRQLFLATIEEVRGHFRELFRRLFGGGEADIVLLEDGETNDVLDCGIDIEASPPGKELRSISLLSGGEKTMTCVALLLAVFRTKPSPFCVLDEVDAALDEANIGRFCSVLTEFLSATQFIVVTHSKKTMTGADTLYGVTMQESGVSKQVAVRFEDVSEDGQIAPAAMLRSGSMRNAA